MRLRIETARGALIQDLVSGAQEGEPPGVVFWDGRTFRFERTDGLWDQRRHVYREVSTCDLGPQISIRHGSQLADGAQPQPLEVQRDEASEIRLKLTKREAALLVDARKQGAYATNKAALIAGLGALRQVQGWSDETLIDLLTKRLRARRSRLPTTAAGG